MNGNRPEQDLTTASDATPACSASAALAIPIWVSVIVRSMNRRTLIEALDSIALQDYASIQVVLVNALGSAHPPAPPSCGSFPVVAAAATASLPLPRAKAANLGLEAATGSLVLFLDDDDVLLPQHISRLVTVLQAHPLAPAAFADVEMGRDSEGDWQALHRFEADFDGTRLFFENYLPIHGVLFRRPLSPGGPRFDEDFDLFEDWDFWLQLASLGPFVHLPGVTARYRVSEIEQSNVFADSTASKAARQRLFEKWQSRISPTQHCALLSRLQLLFREAPQLRAQADLARVTAANFQDILQAREAELAQAAQMLANLEAVLAARERELAEAQQQRLRVLDILAERERELKDAHLHSSDLERILAAREQDASASAAHAAALSRHLLARERELGDTHAHVAGIEAILAAREREAANALAHATGLELILAERNREVADALLQIKTLREALSSRGPRAAPRALASQNNMSRQSPVDASVDAAQSPPQKEEP